MVCFFEPQLIGYRILIDRTIKEQLRFFLEGSYGTTFWVGIAFQFLFAGTDA